MPPRMVSLVNFSWPSTKHAESHAAAAGRRVVNGQLGLEALIGLIQVVGQSGRAVHAYALQV